MARARDIRGPYENPSRAPCHLRRGLRRADPAHRARPICRDALGRPLPLVPDGPADPGAGRHRDLLPAGSRDRAREGRLARRLAVARGRRAWSRARRCRRRSPVDPPLRASGPAPASGGALPPEFQWLRTPGLGADLPHRRRCAGADRPRERRVVVRAGAGRAAAGGPRLRRRDRRWSSTPEIYQQGAGLATYYNRHKFHALVLSDEPGRGRALAVMSCPGDWPDGRLSWPAQRRSGGAGAAVAARRGGGRAAAVPLAAGRRLGDRRAGARRGRDLRRGRAGRACLVHRRLRRHARLRPDRARRRRRGSPASTTCPGQ